MSASFYDLLKYAHTGIASPDMTAYDKMRAASMGGGKAETLTGVPPLSFRANGTPLISWSMLGNGSQSSTPTPDNPVMPTFCGVRTGNLFDQTDFKLFQVTTTAYRYGTTIGVLPQGIYTFNATKSAGEQSIYLTAKLNGTYSQTTISSVPFTFSSDGESEYIIRTANNTGTTWEAVKYSDMMLNSGSTPLPYEPYGWAEKIACAGQTVPVYLGQTQTVRRVKKLVLTGEETIFPYDATYSRFAIIIPDSLIVGVRLSPAICSHYQAISDGRSIASVPNNAIYSDSGSGRWFIKTTDITTVADFKSYLATQYAAGTPVTVWYVLATPTTGIINEPLAKIGDYCDELSSTDAGVSIPTAKGANTLTVDTELQPSSMTITYR